MKKTLLTVAVVSMIISASYAANEAVTVQTNAMTAQPTAQTQAEPKKSKQQIAQEKKDTIRKQIIEKEQEAKEIRKTTSLRASEKRPILQNLEREIQKLNQEYAKIK